MRRVVFSYTSILFVLAVLPGTSDAVQISELMASNNATIADEDGAFSDWIELYNSGTSSIDLDGYFLTDSVDDLAKWRFPAVSVPAGGYLMVWASDKNRIDPADPLHTNFKLSSEGEYLALVRPDGSTVEHDYAPEFPPLTADVSYGVATDGITELCFESPSPGSANGSGHACGLVEPLAFSIERGFFMAPFSVEISTPTPNATIYYSLDSSTPNATNGTPYTGAIPISTTAVLRAVAYADDLLPPPVVSHTYLFLADVIRQNEASLPPEYPSKWGGGTGADYDMDPEVVDDPAYASTIIDDLKAVPTLSISTDVGNLFDPQTGIYVHTRQRGEQWERTVSVELFDAQGNDEFQVNAGLRITGDYSRFSGNKKHNMRLLFKSIHGPSKLIYPLFRESPVDRFDTLVLTAGHGTSFISGSQRAQYIRDTWHKDTQLDMGRLASHSRQTHLYLNGMYWGVYRVTERPTGSFMAEHLGGDKDEYDAINGSGAKDGDYVAYNTMQDLANQGLDSLVNYHALEQYVDFGNLIDYMLVNFYSNNNDWDYKNFYTGRRRTLDGRFRFFAWDSEVTFQSPNGSKIGTGNHGSPSAVYNNLRRESPEFKLLFADHARRHFFNGGALTPKAAADRWMKRAAELDRAIVGESARWGDKASRQPLTRDNHWKSEQQRLLLQYFPIRTRKMMDQLRAADLYPDVDAPDFSRHGGDVPVGFVLTITAPEEPIYFTRDGSDPRLEGGAISSTAELYTSPITIDQNQLVSARVLSNGEWSARNEAEFVIATPLRISEIYFHPQDNGDVEFVEFQNVGAASFNLGDIRVGGAVTFSFPPMLLGAGARTVIVRNQVAFASVYGAGVAVAGEYSGALSNAGERIIVYDADGGTIQDFVFSDDWYPETDGNGSSLIIRDVGADKRVWGEAAGWRPSTFSGGSPGAASPALCNDGVDNDGDGLSDFGSDPGCESPTSDNEAPQCNDGIDNDSDGAADLLDGNCTSESADSESAGPIGAVTCYQVRAKSDGARFVTQELTITDELGGTHRYDARKERELCLSTDLNEAGAELGEIGLASYAIREAHGEPRAISHAGILVEGAIGRFYLDTGRVQRVMVPTRYVEGNSGGAVILPGPGEHPFDQYKCYDAKAAKRRPRYFPSGGAAVRATNAWEDRLMTLKFKAQFCVAAEIDGSVVQESNRHLLCLRARGDRSDPRHVARAGISVANTLAEQVLDTRREKLICTEVRMVD